MKKVGKIRTSGGYRVFKKFHIRVSPLTGYLVKTLGIDFEDKKESLLQKVRHSKKPHPRFNKKSSLFLHGYLVRKRNKRRTKKKRHEHAKTV